MQIADQRRSSPAPCRWQVRELHRGSSDSRPACVENAVKPGQYCSPEQQFHGPMEVHVQPSQPCYSENNPGQNRRGEEETQEPHPNRSTPVKRAQNCVCIAKGEQRGGNKADRQKAENQFDAQRPHRLVPCERKRPRLVQEKMRQKKNGLNNCNETD